MSLCAVFVKTATNCERSKNDNFYVYSLVVKEIHITGMKADIGVYRIEICYNATNGMDILCSYTRVLL